MYIVRGSDSPRLLSVSGETRKTSGKFHVNTTDRDMMTEIGDNAGYMPAL